MSAGILITVSIFIIGAIFSLIQFIVANVFIKKIDEISKDVRELTKELSVQYQLFVLKTDHNREMDEVKKRLDKLEEF